MPFETERLFVRPLEKADETAFFDLMSNPNVMEPIPQKPMNKRESDAKLEELMSLEKTSDTKIWCLCIKGSNSLIGICGILKNNNQQNEIAYRLLERVWGQGFGTEITKGLIDHCFGTLRMNLITADVCVDNFRSVKILNRFFSVEKDFFNAEDKCVDRRYQLKKADWLKQNNKH